MNITLDSLYTALNATQIPCVYGFYPEGQRPTAPYIEYQVAYSSNMRADGKVYKKFDYVDIFLFTEKKDKTKETLVETALDCISLPYDKTETYLNDERVYQIIYEVKIDG